MDNWINTFRSAETTGENDKVLIPGDPEREISEERQANGIPLLPAVVGDLSDIGKKFDLKFQEFFQ
jgi:LDH2 family malate/lactate/ureidoglycolate dehydrogenase